MLCQHCQSLILDSLYGLLDEPEAAAVESHLRECAACATARAEATRVQGMLARAARGAFPQVKFEPPTTTPPPRTIGSGLLDPAAAPPANAPTLASPSLQSGRSARLSVWLAWVVAASVLIAIPSTVVPVLNALDRAEQARLASDESNARVQTAANRTTQAAADVEARRQKVNYDLVVARQAQENLFANWVADEKALLQSPNARKTTVEVQKAATTQPGAPNEVWLVLHDRGPTPHTRLLAEVRDQTDAVVYSQRLDPERRDNRHVLHLPADIWTKLTPQSELFLAIAAVDEKTGTKTEVQEKVRLFGPVYATYLTTDRAAYRPGDTLYFRSLTLDRISFQPPPREQVLMYELRGPLGHPARRPLTETGGTELVRIREGKVEPIPGPDGKPLRGVGCGAFALPADLPSGDYQLVLHELEHPAGFGTVIPPYSTVIRPIKVESGAPDVYAKMIHYAAASYSAGETVEAWAELKFQGEPAAGIPVRAVATADTLQLNDIVALPTNKQGRSLIRFTLPQKLDQGDVRLKVMFQTKAGEETVAERVPVVGRRAIVEFFPEGGTLVAGVPCRMYVRATTPTGQPVDIKGTITDGRETMARLETLTDRDQPGANRGIGVFTYTPTLRSPLWLKLEAPGNIFAPILDETVPVPIAPALAAGASAAVTTRTGFALPRPVADGVVMSVPNPVTAPGEPFRVLLQSAGRPRQLVVGAYTRGRLSDTKRIGTQPGKLAAVELMGGTDPRGGVVRITIFEEPGPSLFGDAKPDLKPLAERLVFRKPGETLSLAFAVHGPTGVDGTLIANSPVELSITARDENGKPAAAILWAAAVNSGVAPGKRDRLPTTHFLLAGEISTPDAIEYADFLLTDRPRAAECLDLVLATQGWRRFVEQTPAPVNPITRGTMNPDRSRLLSINGQFMQFEHPGQREQRKLFDRYRPRYEQATQAVAAAKTACDAVATDTASESRVKDLAASARQAHEEAVDAAGQARAAAEPVERIRGSAWYGVAGFGLLAVMLGVLALVRPLGRIPFGIGTAGSVGLAAFLVVVLGTAERTDAAIRDIEVASAPEIHFTVPAPAPRLAGSEVRTDKANGSLSEAQFAAAAQDAAPVNKTEGSGGTGGRAHPMTSPMFGGPKQGLGGPAVPAPAAPNGVAGAGGGGFPKVDGSPRSGGVGAPPKGAGPGPGGPVKGNGLHESPTAPLPPGAAVPGGHDPSEFKKPSATTPGGLGGMPGRGGVTNRQSTSDWFNRGDGRRAIPDWELMPPSDPHPVQALRRLDAAHAEQERLDRTREQLSDYATKRMAAAAPNLEQVFPQMQGLEKQKKVTSMAAKAPEVAPDVVAYNRVRSALVAPTPLVVREYAAPRPGAADLERDAPDTVLWQPVIVLPADGKATLPFQLGSARGGYQVIVAGHTLDGRLGAVRGVIRVAPAPEMKAVP